MKTLCTVLLGAMALSMAACTIIETENSNKKLAAYPANSPAYKQTLAAELKAEPESFTYTLNGYAKKAGAEYLSVRIQRAGFDGVQDVLVNNWDKIEGIRKTKGMGYRSAELKGLKLELVNTGNELAFVYKGVDKIVD